MIKDKHQKFLEEIDAHEIKHSGRTLYKHLAGTHKLLESWGAPEDTCTAGLFHSIYGTVKFRHQAWPLNFRTDIMELIGEPAEMLVYLFCVVMRPEAWFSNNLRHDNGNVVMIDTFTRSPIEIEPDQFKALLEIEAANLLEQRSKSRSISRLLEMPISMAAKRAIMESKRHKWERTA